MDVDINIVFLHEFVPWGLRSSYNQILRRNSIGPSCIWHWRNASTNVRFTQSRCWELKGLSEKITDIKHVDGLLKWLAIDKTWAYMTSATSERAGEGESDWVRNLPPWLDPGCCNRDQVPDSGANVFPCIFWGHWSPWPDSITCFVIQWNNKHECLSWQLYVLGAFFIQTLTPASSHVCTGVMIIKHTSGLPPIFSPPYAV